jgi:diguanylate cyclase (GGDEF)-like protein
MVVAVDHFEEFGDTHGEPMKNLVLRTVATFLSAAIREMDSVARFDEDSFVIMLPGTTIAAAGSIADRLRQSISMHALKSPTGNLKLTVSVGVAEVETSDDADTLSQRSRDAADSAKMTGGNRVCLFRNGLCVGLQAEMAQ